jgi:predicted lipoprotein with Yx(FWY)xxD motif
MRIRITMLVAAGATAVALSAAACSSSSSSGSAAPTSAPASASSQAASGSAASSPAASGSAGSGSAAASGALKTEKVSGATVLANAKGFTLYSFAPDTATTSKCTGACAQIWPPVPGPATAGSGVTGKLGTITRSDGTTQATYNGHPLYTYAADTSPGQASGNGLNVNGGVWHVVPASGAAPPASSAAVNSGGVNGY